MVTCTGGSSTWQPTGSDDHFADQASQWNAKYRDSEPFRARLHFVGRAILDSLEGSSAARVLDFGGGTGLFGSVAATRAALVVSVDRSLPMLRSGARDDAGIRESIRSAGLADPAGRLLRLAGDEHTAGALRARFDVVVAIAVVEYAADCRRLVAELASALDRGGRMVITVPNPRSPVRVVSRLALPVLRRLRPSTARLRGQSYLLVRPHGDRPPWRLAAEQAGLSVRNVRPVPFGRSGIRSLVHPNLLVELGKL